MRILAARHPEAAIHITRLLDEVRSGWQGRSHAELEEIGFNFYDKPLDPMDEKLGDVWERLQRFVRLARRRHPGESVVGVTHGDPVIIARAAYLRLPLEVASIRHPNIYPGKGSITRLTFGPELEDMYPLRLEYCDPNGEDSLWSQGWVTMEPSSGVLDGSGLRDPYQ